MRVVIIRFSSLGDIVLLIPVLRALKQQYPYLQITLISRPYAKSLFKTLDIDFYPAELNGKHKGLLGLYRLFKEVHQMYKPDFVVDLHNVLRSRILGSYFKTTSILVFKLNKGRAEKKALTRRRRKVRKHLKHTIERYAEVFGKAAFTLELDPEEKINLLKYYPYKKFELIDHENDRKAIGIAPMARHKGKVWPIDKVKELIDLLLKKNYQVVLFGSEDEWSDMEKLVVNKDVINIAGNFTLNKEMEIMSQLDVMVTMDSSNMHMASLTGTPVVSIWGATHSFAGFGPLGGNERYKVEISTEELKCRPCSVFGNKPCLRGDYACMNWITPEMVKEKIDFALLNK